MSAEEARRHSRALAAMRELTSLPAVIVCLDGQRLVAAFELNLHEHARRSTAGVGAVTSRAVLHGLWLLPTGIPVPVKEVPAVKRRRLREAHHFALETDTAFERLYSPAGVVRAVAFAGARASRCVERAIRFPPIVERVVVTTPGARVSNDARRLADEFGIGIVESDLHMTNVVVQPHEAVIGVPAVYRWWIAELAYEAWLQESAQPVS